MQDSLRQAVLSRLLEWWKDVPGVKRSHAVDGLFITQGYVAPREVDDDSLFVWALVLTFWFWLDDRSDEELSGTSSVIDWATLLSTLEATEDEAMLRAMPASIEAGVLRRVSQEARASALSAPDYGWWRSSAACSIRAFFAEERISRAGAPPAYSDYLEIGLWSSTIPNLLATGSLLYGMKLAERRREPDVIALERYLSIVARLQNDLLGFEKERREGSVNNSVLLMERFTPSTDIARNFVEQERQVYERRLSDVLCRLGAKDPLVETAKAMLASHRQFYEARPRRVDAVGRQA